VASVDECAEAVEQLGKLLGANSHHAKKFPDRTISCTIPDLAVTFRGEIRDGELVDVTTEPGENAQVRLTVHSDDLVDLVNGELGAGKAFMSGKLKVDASFGDLMRLRSLG
jgi:putative sterol carrier protein